ncbi:MAG: hypothetical protein E7576_14925 [Ruminococcaceae bacterium]|jgi:hexosaminidase|nr:hypothetical protein [Oscillospiraceae bacterium]
MKNVCKLKPVYASETLFSGCASVFAEYAARKFGVRWSEGEGGLILSKDDALPFEGYRLESGENVVVLSASSEKGMHNALADLLSKIEGGEDSLSVPVLSVTKSPDCSYRGLLVDLARIWHPLPDVLRFIDLCWENRASHLQLHFTDFPSFTLPMTAYPKLSTEGRSYTREEIRTIVDYAKSRGIVLVPEVDVPGHTSPFYQAYPEIFGTTGVLPACDEVFDALRTIFGEVAEMFPYSPMIHLGGDEAFIDKWEGCERTKAYMAEHGIRDIHEMYAEYIRTLTEMIFSLGRTPVVWEGFAKEYNDRIDRRTVVIAWESLYQPAYDLAEAGFTLINCSWKPLYICTGREDRIWSPEEIAAHDPWRWENFNKRSLAYHGFNIDRKYPVLGSQICAWGDYIAGWEDREEAIHLEARLVAERLPALCKKLWDLGGSSEG